MFEVIKISTIGFLALLGSIVLCTWITTCDQKDQACLDKKSERAAAREAQEEKCKTPILVSEASDVKLYAINYDHDNCNNRIVYFSSGGTHTTHIERHGKTSTVVDDDVSSSK